MSFTRYLMCSAWGGGVSSLLIVCYVFTADKMNSEDIKVGGLERWLSSGSAFAEDTGV